jgi:hypothetical protein
MSQGSCGTGVLPGLEIGQPRQQAISRVQLALLTLLVGACAPSTGEIANQGDGRCLYVVERRSANDTKWGPCTSPPACATQRLTGDDRSRLGPGC